MRASLLILLAAAMTSTCLRAEEEVDTVASITGIEIVTSVDRAEMYVGDLINYTITIEHDSTIELLPPPLGANLGAFDIMTQILLPDFQTAESKAKTGLS